MQAARKAHMLAWTCTSAHVGRFASPLLLKVGEGLGCWTHGFGGTPAIVQAWELCSSFCQLQGPEQQGILHLQLCHLAPTSQRFPLHGGLLCLRSPGQKCSETFKGPDPTAVQFIMSEVCLQSSAAPLQCCQRNVVSLHTKLFSGIQGQAASPQAQQW